MFGIQLLLFNMMSETTEFLNSLDLKSMDLEIAAILFHAVNLGTLME